MKKMFGIYHVYDTDWGNECPYPESTLIAICYDEDVAKRYVQRFSRKHVYDNPCVNLECGDLYYVDMSNITTVTEENEDISPWNKDTINNFGMGMVVANDGNDWNIYEYDSKGNKKED